jgi:20S proteasome subunit beta 5
MLHQFADRFSTTSSQSEIRRAQALAADDEDFSDSAWGSEAGFGSLAKGVPTFSVPAVPDVSAMPAVTSHAHYFSFCSHPRS